jgi:hypothetical protein
MIWSSQWAVHHRLLIQRGVYPLLTRPLGLFVLSIQGVLCRHLGRLLLQVLLGEDAAAAAEPTTGFGGYGYGGVTSSLHRLVP